MKLQGFVLQTSYRVVDDARGGRIPVVHVHGCLPGGGSFLLRDRRVRPMFYVRTRDAPAAARHAAGPLRETSRRTFDGAPLSAIEVEVPGDVPSLRDRLEAAGIETFEADVRFAVRYLFERGIRGGIEIEGEARRGEGVDWVFDDPEIRPCVVEVSPRVLSFDIETDAQARRLLAISLFSPGVDEVLVVDGSGRVMPDGAIACATERDALERFCARVAAIDPDVLTGWNIIDFDLSVLARIALRVRHPLALGRGPGAMRVRRAEGWFGSGQATIPGRLVLDGIDLLRGAFVRMDDYSLDAVARNVLGEGKAVAGDVHDRVGEIAHNYRHDLPAFVHYARTDARLAYAIVERLKLVGLAFARSRLTGMTPDRVAASIASFDFLYLSRIGPLGIVAPCVRSDRREGDDQHGGHVLEPVTGLHENVWVFDFKSLYPSIIRTFNIDPLTFVADVHPGSGLIDTPGGAFRREPGILPGILDELFPQRAAAKREGDTVAANAVKILMNSFYGVLGTPACRFYNPALANAITGLGRELLLWAKDWFEAAGYAVLYGDTDSLFVRSGERDPSAARARGPQLAREVDAALAAWIAQRWQLTSRLELEFEKTYVKLFLPTVRHGTAGARKRYAGLLEVDGTPRVEFVGMEVVRRDWTELAKQVQRELYTRLFAGSPVEAYLADIVGRVRRGECDELLVYRKNLRKGTEDYTATTPPHVVAARKLLHPPGRLISYVVTTAGPEPIGAVEHAIDREHYVEKQVKPVAEPVLATFGLDFARVIGDDRQLDLYATFDRADPPVE